MARFNLKEKTFIIFVILVIILNFNMVIGSLFSIQTFLYAKFLLLYLFLYLVSIALLFINTNKTKKIAWVLALTASLIFLFNPMHVPTNPSYMWGSFISLIQSLIWKDFTTALLQLNRSLIPLLVSIYSIFELKSYNNKSFDKIMGITFIALLCSYLFADKLSLGNFELTGYLKPLMIFIAYILIIILWTKFEK